MAQQTLTVLDLLATAAAIESTAAKRYAQLAAAMKGAGNTELEALFRHLQHEEDAHLDTLRHWGAEPTAEPRRESASKGLAPEGFHDEEETFDPYTLTAYRALSIAVRNEDRAFAFFAGVAADADEPEVRALAERLAHEELTHAAKLRQARRLAYHAEGRHPRPDRWGLARATIATFTDFQTIAHRLEAGMAARHEALAAGLAGSQTPSAEAVAAVARRSHDVVIGLGAADSPAPREAQTALPPDGPSALRDMLFDLEDACGFYMRVAETGLDELTLVGAQRLAYGAVSRLAVVRGALSQHEKPPAG